jgi:hypothetical protein
MFFIQETVVLQMEAEVDVGLLKLTLLQILILAIYFKILCMR